MLSVVIPSFNEETNILNTAKVLGDILKTNNIPYELIFVDDGSTDKTWEQILNANKLDKNIYGISFSRNFGKESAMLAGLSYAKGDCVAVIDCDLQHPPIKLVEMFRKWEEGAKVVEGVKSDRGEESIFHALATKTFYSLISSSSKVDMSRSSDYKLMDKQVVSSILILSDAKPFFRAASSWVGFNSQNCEYEVCERINGTSKWNTIKLIRYAIDNISSYSNLPLKGSLIVAAILSIAALVLALLSKNTAVIIIQLILNALVFAVLGIIGYYVGRVFDEVKLRPKYIIEKTIGDNQK